MFLADSMGLASVNVMQSVAEATALGELTKRDGPYAVQGH